MHLLAQESPPVAELKEIFSDIAKADERAGEIIRGMSALIRKRELETQPVDVNLLVAYTVRLVASDAPVASRDRRITVRSLVRDRGLHVAVTDPGRGIPPDLLSGIFEPFQTTKSNGLGIGLSIARGIIETHGGRISAENGVHGGAIVGFTLPIVHLAGSRPGERAVPLPQRASSPWPSASVGAPPR
ncbi:MAG TPA: ATP-binding protein [Vicinamibacterales bacterium]|nr:ATP-binding protein [Vicinamibacterales bacterium]